MLLHEFLLSFLFFAMEKIETKILGLKDEVCSARQCNYENCFLPVAIVEKRFSPL